MTDNYHSGIDRITSSGLKILLKKSPAHYYAEYMGERTPPTSAMEYGLKEAPEYGPLLFGPSGVAEVVMEWRDAITGAEAKCKPDWMSKDGRLIIDLKMMADADPTNFKRSVYRYGYHVSAAMYIEGVASHFNNTPTFVWAVCEKGSGNIAFYTPSAELLSEGHDKVGHGMSIYAECKQRKAWPGYSNELVEIG